MTPDPRDDQADARERDLRRFFELARPHLPDDEPVPEDLLDRMSDAGRTEALDILARLNLGADPGRERERQKLLLGLARIETDLRDLLAKGDPRMRNGKILRDPQTGEILRNRTTDRRLRALLRQLEQQRSRITGLPPDPGGQDAPLP